MTFDDRYKALVRMSVREPERFLDLVFDLCESVRTGLKVSRDAQRDLAILLTIVMAKVESQAREIHRLRPMPPRSSQRPVEGSGSLAIGNHHPSGSDPSATLQGDVDVVSGSGHPL